VSRRAPLYAAESARGTAARLLTEWAGMAAGRGACHRERAELRSRLRAGSGYPAAERLVPVAVRRLEEHRLPELVMAAVAGDQDVTHATAALGSFAGRVAQARFPAHLRPSRPQWMTERAALRLVTEHRNGHLNDHALTSSPASTIITAHRKRASVSIPGPAAATSPASSATTRKRAGRRGDSLLVHPSAGWREPVKAAPLPTPERYSRLPDPPRTRLPSWLGGVPGRCAETRFPAHRSHAGPQFVTKRASFWHRFEQIVKHEDNRVAGSGSASIIARSPGHICADTSPLQFA
jgi:hypothetical protein